MTIRNLAENDKVRPFTMGFEMDGAWQDMSTGWTCHVAVSNEDKSSTTGPRQITDTQLVDGVQWFAISMNDTEAAALTYTDNRKGFTPHWFTVQLENTALNIREETDIVVNVRKQAVN